MEMFAPQHQQIVIYPSPRMHQAPTAVGIIFLLLLALDTYIIWAFLAHYEIDTGPYATAFIFFCITLFFGWFTWHLFRFRYRLQADHQLIIINDQGIFTDYLMFRGSVFIPWEAISSIAAHQVEYSTYFCIYLKDTPRYWFFSGERRPRPFRRSWATGADISIPEASLDISAREILMAIQQNYTHRLAQHHILLY